MDRFERRIAAGPIGSDVFRYGRSVRPFTNEELLGEALEPFRDKVIIASKFLAFDGS